MKKAKSEKEFKTKTPDFTSILEGFKQGKEESLVKPTEEKILPQVPVLDPLFYNKNAYNDIIAKHDKIVNRIMSKKPKK